MNDLPPASNFLILAGCRLVVGRYKPWWLSSNFQRKWCQWRIFGRYVHVYYGTNTSVYKAVPHEMGGLHNAVQRTKAN